MTDDEFRLIHDLSAEGREKSIRCDAMYKAIRREEMACCSKGMDS